MIRIGLDSWDYQPRLFAAGRLVQYRLIDPNYFRRKTEEPPRFAAILRSRADKIDQAGTACAYRWPERPGAITHA